jgi:hypothetical protein
MWLGLGLAGAVLAACCGVGVVAVGGLLVLGQEATNEQAQRAVEDYLAAVAEQDWERAHELRCGADRRAESLPEFTQRVSALPRIESYQLGDVQVEPTDDPFEAQLSVPAEVSYTDGSQQRLTFPVEQDPAAGRIVVCGPVGTG